MKRIELIYVADPMCSWCWGFKDTLAALERRMPAGSETRLVLGGLAPDSDEPMDDTTRAYVQRAWHAVEKRTGASFDHSFWSECKPRRSTWRSCRAVLAAGTRGRAMFDAIQHAYYQRALNPSDRETLIGLAQELELDTQRFAAELDADETRARLQQEFAARDSVGGRSFPTLCLRVGDAQPVLLCSGWSAGASLFDRLAQLGVELSPAT